MPRPNEHPPLPQGLPDYSMMVLLVDDQAMIGEAVRRALSEESDIDFHFCSDPHQALSVAQQIKPTVILQDLIMPGQMIDVVHFPVSGIISTVNEMADGRSVEAFMIGREAAKVEQALASIRQAAIQWQRGLSVSW